MRLNEIFTHENYRFSSWTNFLPYETYPLYDMYMDTFVRLDDDQSF